MTNADRSTTHRLRFSIVNATGFVESPNDHAFSGEEDYNGMKVYFYGTVDGTVKNVETEGADNRRNVLATVESASGVLEMRYGIFRSEKRSVGKEGVRRCRNRVK